MWLVSDYISGMDARLLLVMWIVCRLSVLDHSCDPDAFIVFDGPKAILRALTSPNDIHSLDQVYNVSVIYISRIFR